MVDLIKPVMAVLLKLIPALSKHRRDQSFNKIGARLFIIYFELNEIVLQGEQVLRLVRAIIDGDPGDVPRRRIMFSEVRQAILAQRKNLERIKFFFTALSHEGQLMSGDVFLQMVDLLQVKEMEYGPLWHNRNNPSTIARIANNFANSKIHRETEYIFSPSGDPFHDAKKFPDPEILDEQEFESMTSDLLSSVRVQELAANLESIKLAVEAYRSALGENFAITEILPIVADPKFSKRNDRTYRAHLSSLEAISKKHPPFGS